MRNLLRTDFLCFVTLIVIAACNKTADDTSLQNATPKVLPTTLYVRAGNSAVINLAPVVSSTAQMRFSKMAQNGSLGFEGNQFIRYAPQASFTDGKDAFTVEIDGNPTIITVVVVPLTVATLPCEAGAFYDKALTNLNTPVSVDVLANDNFCNGADLSTFRILLSPTNGRLTVNGSTLIFTPNVGFVGLDKAIYTISGRDSIQQNSSAEVYFNVVDNTRCLIDIQPLYLKWSPTPTNLSLTIDVFAKNTLCNLPKSSFFISNPPKYGTARFENNKVIYTSNSANPTVETDVIAYALRDSFGATYNAFIQIDPSVCVPRIVGDYAEFTVSAANPSLTIDVLKNDTLCTPSVLSLDNQPLNGITTLSQTTANGIIYRPNVGFTGLDFFTYKVRDSAGILYIGAVKVKVN